MKLASYEKYLTKVCCSFEISTFIVLFFYRHYSLSTVMNWMHKREANVYVIDIVVRRDENWQILKFTSERIDSFWRRKSFGEVLNIFWPLWIFSGGWNYEDGFWYIFIYVYFKYILYQNAKFPKFFKIKKYES